MLWEVTTPRVRLAKVGEVARTPGQRGLCPHETRASWVFWSSSRRRPQAELPRPLQVLAWTFVPDSRGGHLGSRATGHVDVQLCEKAVNSLPQRLDIPCPQQPRVRALGAEQLDFQALSPF